MKQNRWLFFLVLCCFALGCGKKTPPKPIRDLNLVGVLSLPVISFFQTYYREDNLVFIWNYPSYDRKKVDSFGLSVNILRSDCISCSPTERFELEFPLEKNELKEHPDFRIYQKEDRVGLMFKKEATFPLVDTYFQMRYFTNEEKNSPYSEALKAYRHIPIVAPKLSFTVLQSEEGNDSSLFLMEWDPVFEITEHHIDKEGKVKEVKRQYGVNLYLVSEPIWPINSTPYTSGQAKLPAIEGAFQGRFVDRFGNESKASRNYRLIFPSSSLP